MFRLSLKQQCDLFLPAGVCLFANACVCTFVWYILFLSFLFIHISRLIWFWTDAGIQMTTFSRDVALFYLLHFLLNITNFSDVKKHTLAAHSTMCRCLILHLYRTNCKMLMVQKEINESLRPWNRSMKIVLKSRHVCVCMCVCMHKIYHNYI